MIKKQLKKNIYLSITILLQLLFPIIVLAQKDSPKVFTPHKESKDKPILSSKILNGSLVIFSNPSKAKVYINRLFRGETTENGYLSNPILLKSGKYFLEISCSEYEVFQQKITIHSSETKQISANLLPKFAFLSFILSENYPDIKILLDDRQLANSDLIKDSEKTIRIKTSPGTHSIKILSTNYTPFQDNSLIASAKPALIPVTLASEKVILSIKSQPGTHVYVNNIEAGIIPNSGKLEVNSGIPNNKNHILLKQEGYQKIEQEVFLEAGKETVLELQLLSILTNSEFADNFEGGLNFWNIPTEWKIEKGLLNVQGNNTLGMPKNKRFCDCEIIFGLRILNEHGASWILHAKDEKNYYLFSLNGTSGYSPNKFQTYVCQNGDLKLDSPAISPLPIIFPLKVSETYRVRIQIKGNTIQHWITPSRSGKEISIGFFKDSEKIFPCGNVGFATPNNEIFQISGFIIRPLQNE